MTDVLAAVSRTMRTMVDGTVELKIQFEPSARLKVMELFGEPGSPMAVARLTPEAAQNALRAETAAQDYGQHAKALRLSSFFRAPDVWRAIGTDEQYREWIRTANRCIAEGTFGACEGDIVAAHVRRIADGAGVGRKPDFACVPFCHRHHTLQHSGGETAVGGREHFDRQRIIHAERWGWETLKAQLGYAHWSDVGPEILLAWAQRNDVDRYLPEEYRG